MVFVDTHTHLYLDNFEHDRVEVVRRAIEQGVEYMFLPNIDVKTLASLDDLSLGFSGHIFPMLGLHPTSVKDDYEIQLEVLEKSLGVHKYYAIGETGMDLYWDVSYRKEQEDAFRKQIKWAQTYNLPIVIHSRNALDEILEVLKSEVSSKMKGIFHCYPGDTETAKQIIDMGFYIGIGGTVTYKKSNVPELIQNIGLSHIVLETDAPFLPPVPYRGKRNESAFLIYIAQKVAEILGKGINEVAERTTENAQNVFGFK